MSTPDGLINFPVKAQTAHPTDRDTHRSVGPPCDPAASLTLTPEGSPAMAKYRVHLSTVTSITIDVEADDPDAAIEEAQAQGAEGLCHQCSGWGQSWSREEGDELEPDAVYLDNKEVWSSDENWRRVNVP